MHKLSTRGNESPVKEGCVWLLSVVFCVRADKCGICLVPAATFFIITNVLVHKGNNFPEESRQKDAGFEGTDGSGEALEEDTKYFWKALRPSEALVVIYRLNYYVLLILGRQESWKQFWSLQSQLVAAARATSEPRALVQGTAMRSTLKKSLSCREETTLGNGRWL